jgi:hypothetical protein
MKFKVKRILVLHPSVYGFVLNCQVTYLWIMIVNAYLTILTVHWLSPSWFYFGIAGLM